MSDSIGNLYGIRDEELDEDLILRLARELDIVMPATVMEAVDTPGAVVRLLTPRSANRVAT